MRIRRSRFFVSMGIIIASLCASERISFALSVQNAGRLSPTESKLLGLGSGPVLSPRQPTRTLPNLMSYRNVAQRCMNEYTAIFNTYQTCYTQCIQGRVVPNPASPNGPTKIEYVAGSPRSFVDGVNDDIQAVVALCNGYPTSAPVEIVACIDSLQNAEQGFWCQGGESGHLRATFENGNPNPYYDMSQSCAANWNAAWNKSTECIAASQNHTQACQGYLDQRRDLTNHIRNVGASITRKTAEITRLEQKLATARSQKAALETDQTNSRDLLDRVNRTIRTEACPEGQGSNTPNRPTVTPSPSPRPVEGGNRPSINIPNASAQPRGTTSGNSILNQNSSQSLRQPRR